jgi:[acyl-carrier-protein] S-malonyltransferase
VLLNVTAEAEQNPDKIRSLMSRQLCSPVRWYPAMKRLMEHQIDVVVEVGPGRVLAGLLKQILPKDYPCKVYTANSLKNLEQAIQEIN